MWYVSVQCRGHKTESHWHHRSVNKIHTWFGQANVSNSGTPLKQKAASTCLHSVRPDMPRLALVQLSGDLNLHLRLFYTALHEIHRFVNILNVGQCYPILMFGSQSPAGFRLNQLIRDWLIEIKLDYLAGQKTSAHLVPNSRTEKHWCSSQLCGNTASTNIKINRQYK